MYRRSFLLLFLFVSMAKITVYASRNNPDIEKRVITRGTLFEKDQPASIFSDNTFTKLAPLAINLTVITLNSSIAQLSWNAAGMQGKYYVERQAANSGIWDIIKVIPSDLNAQYNYNDTISFPYCSSNPADFIYRIHFVPDPGTGLWDVYSNEFDASVLSDVNHPALVQNVNVTLIKGSTGYNPRISWTPLSENDILGYRISRFNDPLWPDITTTSANSSAYTDLSVTDACDKSYIYLVQAVDRCGNVSDQKPYPEISVHTIKLEVQLPGACDKVAKLSWNSYNSFASGFGEYKIFRSDGTGAADEIDTQDTTFSDNFNFVNGHTYLYTVTAYSNDGLYSSSSCEVSWPFNGAIIPDVYITQVSVESDSYVRVSYQLSPPNFINKLVLMRSDDGNSNWQVIDSIAGGTGIFVPENYYIDDLTADVHTQSYYYQLVISDDCGGETFSPNISRSIWLQCSSDGQQNNVAWNTYESWLHGVDGYIVNRTVDGQSNPAVPFGPYDPATVTFTDPLTDINATNLVCYWVEANENLSLAISKSNTCCIIKAPKVFMPNAFYPDGIKNRVFRPIPPFIFADPQSFKMTIFDRWGQQLFETTDMISGWDGSISGQTAPSGMYVYLLTYKSLEGKEYTKRGTVTLLR